MIAVLTYNADRRRAYLSLPGSTGRDIARVVPDPEIDGVSWEIGYDGRRLGMFVKNVELRGRASDRGKATKETVEKCDA